MIVYPTAIEPPSEFAITLADAKDHLRLHHTSDEDSYITDLIAAAQEWLTRRCERTFTPTWYQAELEEFPKDNSFWLAYPPVQEVVIEYHGSLGWKTYNDYRLVARSNEAIVRCGESGWPSVTAVAGSAPIRIEYLAGGGIVPAQSRHAMRLLVAHWFQNREATVVGTSSIRVSHALDSLVNSMRTGRLGGGYQS